MKQMVSIQKPIKSIWYASLMVLATSFLSPLSIHLETILFISFKCSQDLVVCWFYLVWIGLVWFGLVWFGLVRY